MTKSVKLPKPLPNFVLLKIPSGKKDVSGFAIVKDPKKDDRTRAREGKVLAIGVFTRLSPSSLKLVSFVIIDRRETKVEIKKGDTVFYSSFTGHQIDNKHIFVKYADILGVK